jgi:proteic killer suppression protein
MNDIFDVKLTTKALKELKKAPLFIAIKLQAWIDSVGREGLNEVRKIPGYHDEPLKGSRIEQRSIRLNHAYRAIYIIDKNNIVHFINILEVTKHAY